MDKFIPFGVDPRSVDQNNPQPPYQFSVPTNQPIPDVGLQTEPAYMPDIAKQQNNRSLIQQNVPPQNRFPRYHLTGLHQQFPTNGCARFGSLALPSSLGNSRPKLCSRKRLLVSCEQYPSGDVLVF